MRIMAKRNATDTDMIELWYRNGKNKMLMGVVHQDCLLEIPHHEAGGDDLLDSGMMLELNDASVRLQEAQFWGV